VTVLVADDDPDMRRYVQSCLRGLGPRVGRVLEAADGAEALAAVRSDFIHVVLADVVMPGLDGYALCRAIKEDPALPHVAVLLISGVEDRPAAQIVADAFLAKPFNARRLKAAMEDLLLRRPGSDPAAAE